MKRTTPHYPTPTHTTIRLHLTHHSTPCPIAPHCTSTEMRRNEAQFQPTNFLIFKIAGCSTSADAPGTGLWSCWWLGGDPYPITATSLLRQNIIYVVINCNVMILMMQTLISIFAMANARGIMKTATHMWLGGPFAGFHRWSRRTTSPQRQTAFNLKRWR